MGMIDVEIGETSLRGIVVGITTNGIETETANETGTETDHAQGIQGLLFLRKIILLDQVGFVSHAV